MRKECVINKYNSRVCELGTKCCTVRHDGKMSEKELKELAENYAHCYSFVGDDSMPIAREKLYKAIDSLCNQSNRNGVLDEAMGAVLRSNYPPDGDAIKAIEALKEKE